MANTYVQFCELLRGLTEIEEAWLREALRSPEDLAEDAYDGWEKGLGAELAQGADVERWPDFGYCFEGAGAERCLVLYSDDCGSVNQVCALVMAFLSRFRPDEAWPLTWACTCSRSQPGAFGGGWLVVTGKGVFGKSAQTSAAEFIRERERLRTSRVARLRA